MKNLFYAFFLVISFCCYSQEKKINSDNYYSYYKKSLQEIKGKKLSTIWLNQLEASVILKEEMEKAGFQWLSNFGIVKIDNSHYVTSICYSEKSKFGFLYEGIHGSTPKAENRGFISLTKSRSDIYYSEKIVDIHGEAEFVPIKQLPNNFYIIKEDIYWYQKSDNPEDNINLVTKDNMVEIFRQDIRKVLQKVRK